MVFARVSLVSDSTSIHLLNITFFINEFELMVFTFDEELTQRVQKAEKAATQRDPNYFVTQFSALKNEETATLNKIKYMEEEIKKNYETMEKMKRECSELERKTVEFRDNIQSQFPRKR
jgi:SMC interacting uncharacterized protein involved in chromosome segregation